MVFVEGDCEVRILEIYFGHVVSFFHDISKHIYALHFEVLGLHKIVQPFEIDNWSLTTIFLGDHKQLGVETLGLCLYSGNSPFLEHCVYLCRYCCMGGRHW